MNKLIPLGKINMKYRILEKSCFYTPQYKKLFRWKNFREDCVIFGVKFPTSEIVVFADLFGAKKFLDEQIKKRQSAKSTPTVHNYP